MNIEWTMKIRPVTEEEKAENMPETGRLTIDSTGKEVETFHPEDEPAYRIDWRHQILSGTDEGKELGGAVICTSAEGDLFSSIGQAANHAHMSIEEYGKKNL
ncbi:hypothetical protein LCGC14_0414510 [marine sediment metagenome]|uniref:Uncharacterized protein n=1 Tax=marine sediment metagenome TaxID=412755 RepID=A0A0F9VEQ8_9ZZZZ